MEDEEEILNAPPKSLYAQDRIENAKKRLAELWRSAPPEPNLVDKYLSLILAGG